MHSAARHPSVSSHDLARLAAGAVARLRAAGAREGGTLAAVLPSGPELAVLIHAAPALGAPLLPLDPALPDATLGALLARADAGLVVAARDLPGWRCLPPAGLLDGPEAAPPPSRLRPDDIALMVATSGSSGEPKTVMLTARALEAAAHASQASTPLGPGDRWLACLPLFHIGGYSILARCVLAGAEAVLHAGFDAERVWHAIQHEGTTHLSLVPTMLARLLETATVPPEPTLRHVLVGGAALSGELAERAARLGWPLQPTYGMSETAAQIATLARLPRPWRPGQVGAPLPGVELALAADGRLKVRGPMLMAGYANPGHAPGDGLEDGWFVTNDLAAIGADGELTVLGRADATIVSGGKKIPPQQVEDALAHCPGIGAVGVVGRPDEVWGEVVCAVYAGAADEAELLAWCRAHVAPALLPRAALRVAALPLLSNGKPDRRALRELVVQAQAEAGRGGEA
jgi:O-succinylbenzoic acid--CoA ligase